MGLLVNMNNKSMFSFIKSSGGSLVSADTETDEWLETKKFGDVILFKPIKARNPKHHSKFFKMLKIVFDNQDTYKTDTDLFVEIKLKCGWYDEHITTKGKLIYIPKSIAFQSMGQDEFNKFYNQAVQVCLDSFIKDEQVMNLIAEGF